MTGREYTDYGFAAQEEFLGSLERHDVKEPCAAGGVPLCYRDGVVYTDDSDSHTLIFGSTGTKKTRNFCIPTIYSIGMAGESMIISDPKGEIYRNTSGFLAQQGYAVKVINLRNPQQSLKWNPLLLPYWHYKAGNIDKAVEMVTDLALQLATSVHTDRDPFWEHQAEDLFVGLVLMLFECELDENKVHMESIQSIRIYIKLEPKSEENEERVFWDFLESFPEGSLIRIKLASIYSLRNTERTFASVVATFDSMFRVFVFNQKIMSMLSNSEISFRGLSMEKTALYIITQDEKTTFHFLVSIFVKQCYECLIEEAQKSTGFRLSVRVNFILDEFSNFPKIQDMPAMISAARSRNIRFLLVVQSKQQLQSVYGDDAETIKSNCRNWVYLPCRELGLLREVQELCGTIYSEMQGEVPLVSLSMLQMLKIGWEDSQALFLRPNTRPYIGWVKDFSFYPQAAYEEVPLATRALQAPAFFSVPGYLYRKLEAEMKNSEGDDIDLDDLFKDS